MRVLFVYTVYWTTTSSTADCPVSDDDRLLFLYDIFYNLYDVE